MVKLLMCRICLAVDDQMRLIADTRLQYMYESLTLKPFVTEDIRPLQICYRCYTKLQHCYFLRRKCLQSERLFEQILTCNVQVNLQLDPILQLSTGIVNSLGPNAQFIKGEVHVTPAVCYTDDVSQEGIEDNRDNRTFEYAQHGSELQERIKVELNIDPVLENDPLEEDDFLRTSDLEDYPKEQSDYSAGTDAESNTSTDVENNYEKIQTNIKEEGNVANVRTSNSGPSKRRRSDSCEDITLEDIIGTDERLLKPHKSKISIVIKPRLKLDKYKKNNRKSNLIYQCGVCQKSFKLKCRYENHVCTYQCEICQKRFSHKGHYHMHKRTHTGEKPFQCKVCKRGFNERNRLNNHMRSHTGDTKFQCNVCKKCFNDRSNLHTHIRTHTGEKPYQCHVCKKYFNQKGNLQTHLRCMHALINI